ncbi:cell division FtsK/SpoIIIE [Ammonifex degensii KC4]|uniref:Cell division FtsK/SpoIIIE n=1 Tax=Ammonifex degensii (strain DSM 10501 / KC4) TaxID=429009 RepID=C9R9P4_AMMDK|nr:DNA translocase FtsK [Ammonifex degensii]ACX53023.1 cell division FtsK/SpoIIIE [Ammonifex degensii KC4]
MARKRKKNNRKKKSVRPGLNSAFNREVGGFALILLTALTAVALLFPDGGSVMEGLRHLATSLAGEGRYLFPLFLGWAGYLLLKKNALAEQVLRLGGGAGLLLTALVLIDLWFSPLSSSLGEALSRGWWGVGGGVLGALGSYILRWAFGLPGTYLILGSFSLLGLALVTSTRPTEFFRRGGQALKNFGGKLKQRLEDFLYVEERERKEEEVKRTVPSPEEKEVLPVLITAEPEAPETPLRATGGENRKEPRAVVKSPPSDYQPPPLELLSLPPRPRTDASKEISANARLLEDTLASFGIKVKVTQVSCGPAVTRYEVQPAPGIKVSRIVSLADDIALALATSGVRIEAPIPGKAAIGIEVPNREVALVSLREILESKEFQNSPSPLTIALGKGIAGQVVVADLIACPHLLIAGATGAGKSVCLNSLIVSLLYKSGPDILKFVLIDPKMVELMVFNDIPHLVCPVVTEAKKAAATLKWLVREMERRYELLASAGMRDIARYNQLKKEEPLPYIVVVIDELADLMMVAPVDVEDAICRLAQMARAAGIHLVVATQRPSVDVITGLIKANIPSRISFAVSSQADSRTILDMAGAEKLLGKGDMLFSPVGSSKPIRVQGAYVSDKEVEAVVKYLKEKIQGEKPEPLPLEELEEEAKVEDDELLPQAVEVVVRAGQASASLLQRRLRIGYARAARLIDLMERKGIVGPFEGSKPRPVLITLEQYYSLFGRQK